MMSNAGRIQTRKAYRATVTSFWEAMATLSQIAVEEFPDPDDPEVEVTRYHLDAMRDLCHSLAALVTRSEWP